MLDSIDEAHRDARDAPVQLVRPPVAEWRDWWTGLAELDDDIVRTALRHGFVLTTAECQTLGISRARARNEVRQGRWTDAGRGVVAPVDIRDTSHAEPDPWLEARRRHALTCAGSAVRRPQLVMSGRSAATLHGLPVSTLPDRPEVTVSGSWEGRRPSAHLYGATLDEVETTQWYGVPVEAIGRTLVTLARHGRRDAIIAADAALREKLIDRSGIAAALDTAFGWPWVRQARDILSLADPLAESPLESITRLALHDAGFPAPRLQVIFGEDRVDFYWPRYGLVLEADGRLKYVGDASWKEKQRERRLLSQPGVRAVERVMWPDITTTWDRTSAALWRYFR
jgi:very-short-patch-repair endonuclease